MTIHYHGTPISPNRVLESLAGRHFCVSFWRPDQVKLAHRLGQSVMLDNGAFSAWRLGKVIDWLKYYRWAEQWLEHLTTWAVIPDVIDGTEADNDKLIRQWPFGHRGAPVWHLHESLARLKRLTSAWPRICIGSSGQYARIGTRSWHARMYQAMRVICDATGLPRVWTHMLRGMGLVGNIYPFASVDSTDIGRNHNRAHNTALTMAKRWDKIQCPVRWSP